MNRRHFIFSSLAISSLSMPGCKNLGAIDYPKLTFKHLNPLNFNVANLKVVNVFQPTFKHPSVEHNFPQTPHQAVKNWASERLKPIGNIGTAHFTIEDASVTEISLDLDKGITAIFKDQQSHQYNARIAAKLEVTGVPNIAQAVARASATRSHTLHEGASINDRQKLWFELTELIMRDFDQAMVAAIQKYLSQFLI